MAFHVGQRVVCVRDEVPIERLNLNERMPVKGMVYTVREVGGFVGYGDFIRLEEIINKLLPYSTGFTEPGFSVRRFRPLCESRLDQFRAHLAPTPKKGVPA